MQERKIYAMHKRFGKWEALQCKGCNHLISRDYHGRRYHKCEIYGMSCSEATDWRLFYTACKMYNVPQDMDRWVPLLTQIVREPKEEPPLKGQMRIEEFE